MDAINNHQFIRLELEKCLAYTSSLLSKKKKRERSFSLILFVLKKSVVCFLFVNFWAWNSCFCPSVFLFLFWSHLRLKNQNFVLLMPFQDNHGWPPQIIIISVRFNLDNELKNDNELKKLDNSNEWRCFDRIWNLGVSQAIKHTAVAEFNFAHYAKNKTAPEIWSSKLKIFPLLIAGNIFAFVLFVSPM